MHLIVISTVVAHENDTRLERSAYVLVLLPVLLLVLLVAVCHLPTGTAFVGRSC